MTEETNNSGNNQKGKLVRLPGQRLTDEEKIAIALDWADGKPWSQIVKDRGVSKSTISKVRKEALENKELIEQMKLLRVPRLYAVSEKFLEALDGRGLDEESARDLAVTFGILQDKIQKEEGKTGNVNIAFATLNKWGMLDD